MNVLGIETSCDETAAAVVRDGREVLSSVIFSQIALHRPYNGVVPEIASRSHVENLPQIIDEAVATSGLGWHEINCVAVTYGPGLATSLLVGLSAAKALALRLSIPLVGINHLDAHVYSVFLGENAPRPEAVCPFIALLVSGGHSCLVRVEALGKYTLLGQTVDDAAGEAFDKGANLMGLGYPGGPVVDKVSREGNPNAIRFPRGVQKKQGAMTGGLDPRLCFSFSGLKTALLYYLRDHPLTSPGNLADVAASYQEAVVDSLVERTARAIADERSLAVVGGVSLNSRLKDKASHLADSMNVALLLADRKYCADNAAMVAGLAGAGCGIRGAETTGLDVNPSLGIGEC
jgi:N6-L-threonylcarbamoyladenine synthase